MTKKISRESQINILKTIVGVTLFYLIVKEVDFASLKESFIQGAFQYLLLGVIVITLAQVFLQTLRFHYIIRGLNLKYSFSLNLSLIGLFFNNLLPTAIGGDVARTILLRRKTGIGYTEAITYVILHRASGLLTLISMFFLYLLFNFKYIFQIIRSLGLTVDSSFVPYVLITALIVAIMAFLFKRRVRDFIKKSAATLAKFGKGQVLVIIVLALIYHLSTMLGFYFLVWFFHENIDFQSLVIVQTFTSVAALIPISIGALGLLEGTIMGLFLFFGLSRLSSTGIALIIRLLLIIYALTGLTIILGKKENYKISLFNKMAEEN